MRDTYNTAGKRSFWSLCYCDLETRQETPYEAYSIKFFKKTNILTNKDRECTPEMWTNQQSLLHPIPSLSPFSEFTTVWLNKKYFTLCPWTLISLWGIPCHREFILSKFTCYFWWCCLCPFVSYTQVRHWENGVGVLPPHSL